VFPQKLKAGGFTLAESAKQTKEARTFVTRIDLHTIYIIRWNITDKLNLLSFITQVKRVPKVNNNLKTVLKVINPTVSRVK
jgi:hypothetical protein